MKMVKGKMFSAGSSFRAHVSWERGDDLIKAPDYRLKIIKAHQVFRNRKIRKGLDGLDTT